MEQYLKLVNNVLNNGTHSDDRTGTGTRSLFGEQLKFDLNLGFPAVTAKRLFFKGVVHELLWFLKGSTNTEYLKENNVNIWDAWASENGDLGPVYGKQWRNWTSDLDLIDNHDQIANIIESIKKDPLSRRHIVNAWNVNELRYMALVPCHVMFQFYVRNNRLSCHMYQRSADLFLGVPFNIASYALLTHMIAQICDLDVGQLIISFGDVHLYNNHIEQASLLLTRKTSQLPELRLDESIKDIDDFKYEHIKLINYNSQPTIKADIST